MRKSLTLYKTLLLSVSLIFVCSLHANLPVIDVASIAQLAAQLNQLREQTLYIKQQLDILKSNQYQWSNAQGLINDLGSIINQKNSIAYSASNIDLKFRQAYPGYQAPTDFNKQYKDNTNMTQNTLNGVLQSMGSNAQDFQSENTRLKFLQNQSQSAKGETQAIQASSQIASEMVSQIQLLRQAVIAQSNAETAYYARSIQTEASSKAELEKVINSGSQNVPLYGSGQELNEPDFADY